MTFEIKTKNDKTIIEFENCNRIDTTNLKLISTELIPVVTEFEDSKHNEFVFDFKNIDFIDSSGLSMIINVYKKLSQKEKILKIINVNDLIYNIFKITKLDTFLNISKV